VHYISDSIQQSLLVTLVLTDCLIRLFLAPCQLSSTNRSASIESTPYLFANDGALYFENIKRGDHANVKLEIQSIFKWLQANKLALNNDKTKRSCLSLTQIQT
jgi:hypothetical protein